LGFGTRASVPGTINDSLDKEGIREVEAQALKEVLAWQIEQEMKAAGLTKTTMARCMSPAAPSSTACSTLPTPR
jgi:hypothetical protein